MFTDDGLTKFAHDLKRNTKLAHLSIRDCTNITNKGLSNLCQVISTTNTVLFQIDLDIEQFDQELAITVITESALNRDIQEKLKPVKVRCFFDADGRYISNPSALTMQQHMQAQQHQV